MTNGEKIENILNVDRDFTEVHGENGTMTFTVTQDFWNAEYKEPTTKNDLGVEKIIDEIEKEFEKVDIPIMDKLTIFAKVQNALYKCSELRNSKSPTGSTTKDDLGVDCISREAVERIINKWLSHSDYELKDHIYSMTEKIHNLPSVIPQEPKCKNCKWWKDSDGKYRRGCRAESKCLINTEKVYKGEGYCYRFEPQESEDKK